VAAHCKGLQTKGEQVREEQKRNLIAYQFCGIPKTVLLCVLKAVHKYKGGRHLFLEIGLAWIAASTLH